MAETEITKRDKRAKSIAAMGLVALPSDHFTVTTPSLRGKQSAYTVKRETDGKITCDCLEFTDEHAKDAGFRCEHILAVKYALVEKNVKGKPSDKPLADYFTGGEQDQAAEQPKPKVCCNCFKQVPGDVCENCFEIAKAQAAAIEPDSVTVCLGGQKFAPVSYMSFEVGAVHIKTTIKPGETPETAANRVIDHGINIQRTLYVKAREEFWRNHSQMNQKPQANSYGDRAKETNHGVIMDESPY